MRRDPIAAGVAPSDIVLDYAGFRTPTPSCAPARCSTPTISSSSPSVSTASALFIALHMGIQAQCYAVPSPKDMMTVRLRDLRSPRALTDSVHPPREPRFLGLLIPISAMHTVPEDAWLSRRFTGTVGGAGAQAERREAESQTALTRQTPKERPAIGRPCCLCCGKSTSSWRISTSPAPRRR